MRMEIHLSWSKQEMRSQFWCLWLWTYFCYVLCYADMLLSCLQIDKLRKWKQDHVEQMASDLEDDTVSGGDMDRRLSDLRKEVVTSCHIFVCVTVCIAIFMDYSICYSSRIPPTSCIGTVVNKAFWVITTATFVLLEDNRSIYSCLSCLFREHILNIITLLLFHQSSQNIQ